MLQVLLISPFFLCVYFQCSRCSVSTVLVFPIFQILECIKLYKRFECSQCSQAPHSLLTVQCRLRLLLGKAKCFFSSGAETMQRKPQRSRWLLHAVHMYINTQRRLNRLQPPL